MTKPSPGKENFRQAYRSAPPWDIPGPQPAFVAVADQVAGKVLDAGCGTGENALYFASRGCEVTGIDFLEKPLKAARQKAADRNIPAEFLQADALQLTRWQKTYDAVIDCGLFHTFNEVDRKQYVQGLEQIIRPEGLFVMLCFSDAEPAGNGPRRIAEAELQDSFRESWEILSLAAVQLQVRDDLPAGYFSPGGPWAWRLIAKRLR